MRPDVRAIAIGMVMLAFLLCAAGGCVELKYSAANRLGDEVAIRTAAAPGSVYVSVPISREKDRQYLEYFTSVLSAACEKKGFALVNTPDTADIVIDCRARFYRKADGTFLFILILPIYRFNEDYDGIAMDLAFKTGEGKWRKRYRVHYRGWLADDLEMATDLLCKAIIADLPSPRAGAVENSQ